MELLGKQCTCINYGVKQAIEWALDYHISNLAREIGQKTEMAGLAKTEFKKITGIDPSTYGIEYNIERLQKELDFYKKIRDEVIDLPRCPEPAFTVQ